MKILITLVLIVTCVIGTRYINRAVYRSVKRFFYDRAHGYIARKELEETARNASCACVVVYIAVHALILAGLWIQ